MVLRLRAAQRCSLDLGGPMDWKRFDRVRGNVGPVHLDLVESYAAGRINRREFMRRGAVVGLSLPMIGAVIAARRRRAGRGRLHQRTRRVAADDRAARCESAPRRRGALDPIQMQDLGGLRHHRPVFEFLVTLGRRRRASHRASPSRGSPTRRHASGRSSSARASSGSDGTDFTSADVAATMDRLVEAGERRPRRRHRAEGAVDATDPNGRRVHPRGAERQLPVPRLGVQRPDARSRRSSYETGTTLDASRTAPGRGSSTASTPRPARRSCATRTGGAAQTPLDGHEFTFFDDLGTMVTAIPGRRSRRHRAVLRDRRRRAAQRPELHRARDRVDDPPPDLDALRRPASSSTRRSARRWRYTFDREQMINTLFQGRA